MRSRRTTTSARSPAPTRGSCPSSSCSSFSPGRVGSCRSCWRRSGRAYFLSGEINTPVADVDGKLREIEERYAAAGGRISHLDGVSVDFDDWHFNVRPSNTEPLLRLNLEALDEPEMERRRDEVLDLIRS